MRTLKYKSRNLTDNCCSNTSIPSISPNNSLVSAGKIRPQNMSTGTAYEGD